MEDDLPPVLIPFLEADEKLSEASAALLQAQRDVSEARAAHGVAGAERDEARADLVEAQKQLDETRDDLSAERAAHAETAERSTRLESERDAARASVVELESLVEAQRVAAAARPAGVPVDPCRSLLAAVRAFTSAVGREAAAAAWRDLKHEVATFEAAVDEAEGRS